MLGRPILHDDRAVAWSRCFLPSLARAGVSCQTAFPGSMDQSLRCIRNRTCATLIVFFTDSFPAATATILYLWGALRLEEHSRLNCLKARTRCFRLCRLPALVRS